MIDFEDMVISPASLHQPKRLGVYRVKAAKLIPPAKQSVSPVAAAQLTCSCDKGTARKLVRATARKMRARGYPKGAASRAWSRVGGAILKTAPAVSTPKTAALATHLEADSDDVEMGFVGLAAAAAPVAGKLLKGVGKVFKPKKRKKAKSPPTAAKKSSGLSASDKAVIRAAAQKDVGGSVKGEVVQAIKDIQAKSAADKAAQAAIAKQATSKLSPALKAALARLEKADLQRAVTSEHRSIEARDNFRRTTTERLAIIGSVLARIDATLRGTVPVRSSRLNLLGGPGFVLGG